MLQSAPSSEENGHSAAEQPVRQWAQGIIDWILKDAAQNGLGSGVTNGFHVPSVPRLLVTGAQSITARARGFGFGMWFYQVSMPVGMASAVRDVPQLNQEQMGKRS